MTTPRVTVAMSAYNAEPTIEAAIGSILAQTLNEWELLIADDSSSDATVALARSFGDSRIRVLTDDVNVGKAIRMNALIHLARAPLLAVMDADDVAYPDRLRRQVDFMEAHADVDLCATGMTVFDADGPLGAWCRMPDDHDSITAHPWAGFHFNSPTWMGRTEWFRKWEYASYLRTAEDEDLLLRSFRDSRFAGIPEYLLAYRIDTWTEAKARQMRTDHVRALQRAFADSMNPSMLVGAAVQAAKMARELAAGLVGRQESILSARILPLSDVERAAQRAAMDAASSYRTAAP